MKHTDTVLGFAPELVPLVKNGTKTLTYRLGNKWDFLEVGDVIATEDSSTHEVFAWLRIESKERGTFGTLRDDREGHEPYRSTEERRETFERYYGRPVLNDEPAIIFGFSVLPHEPES